MMFRAIIFGIFSFPLAAQFNVLTYQYDNTRAGQNLNEVLLTKANVNANQFGKLFSYPVDGQIYGQPLYLGGVNVAGNGFHNVVFVATEHDSVYAFDADSNSGANAAPLWSVHFTNGTNITTVPASDVGCGQIEPEMGITSTPVIDPVSGTIYVVAMTKITGSTTSYMHQLHALDVTSGAEKPGSPVTIQASFPGTGEGGSTVVFAPKNYKQRPGLLLLNGVVYTAWSSHCDIGTYHGWLIAYDAGTLKQVAVYNNTPNANQGSFWAGGAAPAADSSGNIFLVAGNGTFDAESGGIDLGESFIKLSSSGGLQLAGLLHAVQLQPARQPGSGRRLGRRRIPGRRSGKHQPSAPDGRRWERRTHLSSGPRQSWKMASGIGQPDRRVGGGCSRRALRESGVLQQGRVLLRLGR